MALIFLGAYVWLGVRRAYSEGKTLPFHIVLCIWFFHIIHHSLVVLSALYSIWTLPFDKTFALICGLVLFATGVLIVSRGLIDFHSFKRAIGLDTSKLVTTGIYQYSRNPQHLGLFLSLLGVSLMGRSGLLYCLQ